MKTTDVPFLRVGDAMPEQKSESKPEAKVEPKVVKAAPSLTPAGEASDPSVHQLLAELATARANGADDDARDIVGYLAELGYAAG